jgi:hypothetical protein
MVDRPMEIYPRRINESMQVLSAIESHALRSNVDVLASPNVYMQSDTFAHRESGHNAGCRER